MRKKIKYLAISMAALMGTMILTGCGNEDKREQAGGGETSVKTQNINNDNKENKTEKKEDETMEQMDMTNGDVAYKTPAGYRARKTDVDYGTIETVQYESTTVGKTRSVTVVLPAGYRADKKYPVLYLCHGLGQDNLQFTSEGQAEVTIGNLVAEGKAKEMILVMPNCRARMNDEGNPPDAFAITNYVAFDNFLNEFQNDLKPFIESHYSVATGRENTAIGGFSMGGRVALHLGFTLQDVFGYIGAFCPAPGIFGYTNMGVTEEGLFTKEEFKIREEYADNTFVMIVGGKTDNVVGSYPQTYHEALKENGVEHIFYKTTGGHDFNVVNHGLYNYAQRLFQ